MNRKFARHLRKNTTEPERVLWRHLRHRQMDGAKFRRQAPIGKYIVDFVCFERKLIVEVDGGPHSLRRDEDERRTEWLNSQAFHVLRFWNHEVIEDLDAVLESIGNTLQSPPPRPSPIKGKGESRGPTRLSVPTASEHSPGL